ncbi:MAG: SIS domain-containing protein [Deltaproteobacteria bacterium]|nr:SIS domain-containing protein [Deltaproteobacteria bacterium]
MKSLNYLWSLIRFCSGWFNAALFSRIYFGRHSAVVPNGSIIFFPCCSNFLCCGLSGIVSFKPGKTDHSDLLADLPVDDLRNTLLAVESGGYSACKKSALSITDHYLGGDPAVQSLFNQAHSLKKIHVFYSIYADPGLQKILSEISVRLLALIQSESASLGLDMGRLSADDIDVMIRRLEVVKDVLWCLKSELLENVARIQELIHPENSLPSFGVISVFKKINAVLNSIDRLEVRGRDSAGISQVFILDGSEYERFQRDVEARGLSLELSARTNQEILLNRGISLRESRQQVGAVRVSVTITYKVAAEIGRLGDNIAFIRRQIREDEILHLIAAIPCSSLMVFAHTRWASVGAISPANCHPVDNRTSKINFADVGVIQAALNGDIDNYQELKASFEQEGIQVPADITTDTKIIPLQIHKFIQSGMKIEEAFRHAVNTFKGSHAIFMTTDLAPGKLFLAQKGSGQTIFVGLGEEYYLPVSEVYGFVEDTHRFVKMDGEKVFEGPEGRTQGQIFILDQASGGSVSDIKATYYNGVPIALGESDIKTTQITSRDIDRQNFPHYFLKEISEAPASVEKTLVNRWRIHPDTSLPAVVLNENVIPPEIRQTFVQKSIRRIFFIGQGTAGIAAQTCADILNYYLDDPGIQISAMKSSELSGFKLSSPGASENMRDVLVIAITQSGTTADTNRTVDMVRERGASTLAIVNRRDSDITFKVQGVMYTSSGRDIEMSVASTKAFYSQIVAGALMGLFLVGLQGRRTPEFISEELHHLLKLPQQMRQILSLQQEIGESARRLAQTRTYWAVVGSGPNKSSADEIRIKLSELCYKTISSDYVEDKKHIDLSSEPLIIVCAAGTRGIVIGDVIKDTAIFKAHKSAVVVIADEGEDRFGPYSDDVFHVPVVPQHLSPVVNTLVGHIWGYYAALAINEGSKLLYDFREELQQAVDRYILDGMDVYELVLERSFREKVAEFYYLLKKKNEKKGLCATMGYQAGADLSILLKYLAGRLPVSDFELDFGKKGTAQHMLSTLFDSLGEAINYMARPIDAIKHQAKTVTVGTSRIVEKIDGIIFDVLAESGFGISQLTSSNIRVLKNLQGIVSKISGSILYSIDGLNVLGEITDQTTISVKQKTGSLAPLTSRVETDSRLQGTKRIIVREGNVFIGRGRNDDRNIIIIPIFSAASANSISNLMLLHIAFKDQMPLPVKIKALGGKHERIKNIVQETSAPWDDTYLEWVRMEDLFGQSAEKTAEYIISQVALKPLPTIE